MIMPQHSARENGFLMLMIWGMHNRGKDAHCYRDSRQLPPEKLIHGTLREAVEAEGPRYIVFAVSGTIRLKEPLEIKNPYITIAGQTAPGDGIQIRNFGIKVETHDVILRHLRIRVGDIKGPRKPQKVTWRTNPCAGFERDEHYCRPLRHCLCLRPGFQYLWSTYAGSYYNPVVIYLRCSNKLQPMRKVIIP